MALKAAAVAATGHRLTGMVLRVRVNTSLTVISGDCICVARHVQPRCEFLGGKAALAAQPATRPRRRQVGGNSRGI